MVKFKYTSNIKWQQIWCSLQQTKSGTNSYVQIHVFTLFTNGDIISILVTSGINKPNRTSLDEMLN